MKKALFFFAYLCILITTKAATYYFAANGDDSRTSTQAQSSSTPWQTISKLNSFFGSLQPGDQVLFRRGDVFSGEIITNKAGTASSVITIGAYGTGAAPVISGFTTVTSWTDLGGNIFESSALSSITAGKRTWMITINGKNYAMGRYPNLSAGNNGYLNYEAHTSTTVTDNQTTFSTDWAGADIILRTSRFTHDRGTISSTDGAHTITFTNSGFAYAVTSNGFGFFLQNSPKTLDEFGEWYYNPATQKLQMYFAGNNPSNYSVMVSKTDTLLMLRHSNITVRDLSFQGGNYGIWNDWSGVNNQSIINCSFINNGIDGIFLSGKTNLTIDSCLVYGNNNDGITIGYHDINCVVSNTTVQNTGLFQGMTSTNEVGRSAYGIFHQSQLGVKGLRAINNMVMNTGYIAIFSEGDTIMIANNFVDSSCLILDDGAGIYTGNYTAQGQEPAINHGDTIMNNVVLHSIGAPLGTNAADSLAHGFYSDDNTNHCEFLGNTAAYNAYAGIYIHNSDSNEYRNNVFYDNHNSQIYMQDDGIGDTIMGNYIKKNQLMCLKSGQLLYHLASNDNNFATFAVIDSNYESQPFNTIMAYRNWFGQGAASEVNYTTAQWNSTLHFDLATSGSPISITDAKKVVLQYNTTAQPVSLKFCGKTYYGLNQILDKGIVQNPAYKDKITIASWNAVVMIGN